MAAQAGAAKCLVTLQRPGEAASLVPFFSVDIEQAKSGRRELLEAKTIRHGTCVLPKFVLIRGIVELKQDDRSKAFMSLASAAKLDPFDAASFAMLGEIYLDKKDEPRAVKCFEKSLGLDATVSFKAFRSLSALYVEKKDMVSVVRLYRTVIEELGHQMTKGQVLDGEKVDMARFAWLRLGQAQYSKDKLLEARRSFQKAVSLSDGVSGSEDMLLNAATIALADTYLRLHQYAAAQQTFESALEHVSNRSIAYVRLKLGMICLALGEPGEAVRHLDVAQQMELQQTGQASVITLWHLVHAQADWIRGLINQNFLLRARSIFQKQVSASLVLLRSRLLEAAQISHSLRQLLPALSKLHADLVSLVAESGDTSELSARRHYAAAVLAEPWNGARWYDLAAEDAKVSLRQGGDTILAQRLAKCAVLLDPTNSDVWNLLGVCYEGQDNRRAVHCFCQATRLHRSNGDAWTNLASMCLTPGQSNETRNAGIAAMCVEKYQSVSMASEDNRSWTLRSRVFSLEGKLDAALAAAECAIPVDLDANEPRVVQRNACLAYLLSFLYKHRDEKTKAIERDNDIAALHAAVLHLAEEYTEFRFFAGLVHEYLGHFDQAIECYQASLNTENDEACKLRMATCYYELGQMTKCAELASDLKEPSARNLLGECLLCLGKGADIDDTFPALLRAKAALVTGNYETLEHITVPPNKVEAVQRFCMQRGLVLPKALHQKGPPSLILHAARGKL